MKKLFKTITALVLSAAMLSPLGDMPLTVGAAACEAEQYCGELSAEESKYLELEEYAAGTLAAPTASRKSGTITCTKDYATIKLSAAKGTVYYSLNGSAYKKYTTAVKLTKNSTIKAYAQSGSTKSKTVTFTYKLKPKISCSVTEASFGMDVKLTTKVSGVKLYYTIDGSKPTTSSKEYPLSGLTLYKTGKLRVIAVKSGWANGSLSKDITVAAKPVTPETEPYGFIFYEHSNTLSYIGGSRGSNIVFPSVFNGKPVKRVEIHGDNQYRSDITSVVIPNSVTELGTRSLAYTNITSLTIPDSVTSIGVQAFRDCGQLTTVTIPNSVTSIGAQAFQGCTSLKSINIPNGVTSIEPDTFNGCTSLKSVTIPNSLTFIYEHAFARSGLTSLDIPDSVKGIARGAFKNCTSLKSVTLSKSMTEISKSAFADCTSLQSITIPDGITTIRENAFANCSDLIHVDLPDSVTRIDAGISYFPMMPSEDISAFRGCNCTVTYKGRTYYPNEYEALYDAINGN